MKRGKWMGWVGGGVCLLVGGLGLIWGWPRSVSQAPSAVQAKSVAFHAALHYSARLAPLEQVALISPADGVMLKQEIPSGQAVKAGQVVLRLRAPEVREAYANAVVAYLKSKDRLQKQRQQWRGDERLWRAGVISDQEYQQQRFAMESADVDVLQATLRLKHFGGLLGVDFGAVDALQLKDVGSLKSLFQKPGLVQIKAPRSGRLLWAPPPAGGEPSARAHVSKGQVLGYVASEQGLSVSIAVGEHDVRRIQAGLHATVRVLAWPSLRLSGTVMQVGVMAPQAGAEQEQDLHIPVRIQLNHGLPKTFSPSQLFGMRAEVTVALPDRQAVVVPLTAIGRDDKGYFVWKKGGLGRRRQTVVLGESDASQVEVLQGVQAGDWVMKA